MHGRLVLSSASRAPDLSMVTVSRNAHRKFALNEGLTYGSSTQGGELDVRPQSHAKFRCVFREALRHDKAAVQLGRSATFRRRRVTFELQDFPSSRRERAHKHVIVITIRSGSAPFGSGRMLRSS
jgi:hypothetical protein